MNQGKGQHLGQRWPQPEAQDMVMTHRLTGPLSSLTVGPVIICEVIDHDLCFFSLLGQALDVVVGLTMQEKKYIS